jgi:cytoskeletal protein RodZ
LGSFGEKLRKQREQRGLELDAISNTTKISPRMLRALEEEHFDQLPGGVFNKGFVRAYARQVGLDEEEAISDYLAALRESQIQQQSIFPDFRASSGKAGKTIAPQAVVPGPRSSGLNDADPHDADLRNDNLRNNDLRNNDLRNNDLPIKNSGKQPFDRQDSKNNVGGDGHYSDGRRNQEDRGRRDPEVFPTQGFITGPEFVPQDDKPSSPIPWGKLAAALFVVALLVVLWNLRRHRELRAAAEPAAPSTQPSATAPASSSTGKASSSDSLTVGKPSAAGTLTSGTLSSGTLSPATVIPQTNSAKSPPTLPIAPPASRGASPSAPTSAAVNKPAAIPSSETAAAPLATRTSVPLLKPQPVFTLLIRAEKTAWVSIVADGKPVAEETLIAPAHTSIRASHEIYVRTGNAAGVSFVLNGKEIPASGADGELKAYIFDAAGSHEATPTQAPSPNR